MTANSRWHSILQSKCFPNQVFRRKTRFACCARCGWEQTGFHSLTHSTVLCLSCQRVKHPDFFFHTLNISITKIKQHLCGRRKVAVSLSMTWLLPLMRSKLPFSHIATECQHANHQPLKTGNRIYSKIQKAGPWKRDQRPLTTQHNVHCKGHHEQLPHNYHVLATVQSRKET